MSALTARLVLASASQRRKQLLEQIGLNAECLAVNVDESSQPGETAVELVRRLAVSKARACPLSASASVIVLAADTVIELDGQVLGKPVDQADGIAMLSSLADREHQVVTGVCVLGGRLQTAQVIAVESIVRFGPVSTEQALSYWNSGEPVGKAGGYAIQGSGAQFVAHLSGSYSNVVGLPLYETVSLLRQAGLLAYNSL